MIVAGGRSSTGSSRFGQSTFATSATTDSSPVSGGSWAEMGSGLVWVEPGHFVAFLRGRPTDRKSSSRRSPVAKCQAVFFATISTVVRLPLTQFVLGHALFLTRSLLGRELTFSQTLGHGTSQLGSRLRRWDGRAPHHLVQSSTCKFGICSKSEVFLVNNVMLCERTIAPIRKSIFPILIFWSRRSR